MSKCMRCKRDMPDDYLWFCNDCLNEIPDEVLQIRDWYEVQLPYPYDMDESTDEYNNRIYARTCTQGLVQRIIDNPDRDVETIIYDYLGDLGYFTKVSKKEDDEYMLAIYTNVVDTIGNELYRQKWRKEINEP